MIMTKQSQLKKQAYESSLKSRTLPVLIYLIDRSNKELTCFPSISTMAKQLHISVSTVKRALRELEAEGYIKKDSRYRSNQGQTSNLYTLMLRESLAGLDLAAGEELGEAERACSGETGGEIEYVTFETLQIERGQKDGEVRLEALKYQGEGESEKNRENGRNRESDRDREWKSMCGHRPHRWSRRLNVHSSQRCAVKPTFKWTGEGVSLRPP